MSETDHQDSNGMANATANGGDVPEIELIIKEEYIVRNEAIPDESDNNDCEEEFINIENECFRELKEENDIYDDNLVSYSKNIKRSVSTSSSMAIEYAIAVAEACEGFDDYSENIENNLEFNEAKKTSTKEKVRLRPPVDEDNMQRAINAVLNDGLSITRAAKKYNLGKSTLWFRIGKQPIRPRRCREQRPVMDATICSKLSEGASLSKTARDLCVSKATIYRHKQHLIETGVLDNEVLMNSPIQQRFSQAHRACRKNGMSVRFAAKFFSLPHASLWRYIKRNEAAKSTEKGVENINIKIEESNSGLEETEELTTVLKDIKSNTEFDQENQLVFKINSSHENIENIPGLENIKIEYTELKDDMIFEDELVIRILK